MEEFACLAGVAFAGSKGGVPPVLSGRDGRDVFRGGIGFQPMIGGVHRQDADATRFRRQKI